MRSGTIGVLALQGGYAVHANALRLSGKAHREVRSAGDLNDLDGLILPGGESTTQLKLIDRYELDIPLRRFIASGKPVLATCAGLILAAKTVKSPNQFSFGWLDVDVERNGWGRQVHSFETHGVQPGAEPFFGLDPLPLMFIRAPRITRVGPEVDVLVTVEGEPVLVRSNNFFGATCHPELTSDIRVHQTIFCEPSDGQSPGTDGPTV